MRIFLLPLIIGFIFSSTILSQDQNFIPNQFLVQLNSGYGAKQLMLRLNDYGDNIKWERPQRLIPDMGIWLLQYVGHTEQAELLTFLSALSFVQAVQYNHKVKLRSPFPNSTTPNDPLFPSQWQYVNTTSNPGTAGVDMDADLAWDITTGGLTAANDTIVVAILDNGISLSHTDFEDNLWVNHSEIPNNHIDDDNNGYEDDYLGWNSTLNSDLIAGGGHGTSVAGIVGAKGDNSNGVTGVNWNVKLMIIRNDWNVSEANVLSAYGYALTQRRIYNQTNGTQGAYVVATNASWGINNGQPSNSPLWCAFYDTLGAHGILNVAATANANVDVDVVGDLPTACPSDYLVAVTNVNNLGYKELAAAYGSTSIDLGSFGSSVYTTISPSGFGSFGGTSGASPHVAAAVALLYSGACSNFIAYSRVYPDSAALKMKQYLLDGVENIVDLAATTVSGGYMNLFNSLNECINDCPGGCFPPYQIATSSLIDTQVTISWVFAQGIDQAKYRYKEQGGGWSNFITLGASVDSLSLNNLSSCTHYDLQLISLCNSATSDTVSFTFKTDGCCEAPLGLSYSIINSDSVLLSWQSVLAASTYIVNYKEAGASAWQSISNITSSELWVTTLAPCTYYDISLQTICNNGDTASFSDTLQLVTLGCTGCNVISYCNAEGDNSSDDWIDTFAVDDIIYASGNDSGYVFFDSVIILLGKGDYHNISISQGKAFTEYIKIWLDINQDGDFYDPDEEIYFDVMGTTDKTMKGSVIIPPTSLLGVTRMRVGMRWNNVPNICGSTDFGEIEDYCVQIIPGNSIAEVQGKMPDITVFPNPFTNQITIQYSEVAVSDIGVSLFSVAGQLLYKQQISGASQIQGKIVLKPKIAQGIYLLQIISKDWQISKRVIKLN
ncbi:S8 family serine peptidase [Aureispira]|nr:S8 family serine peptidase [Aureispira sp.]